MMGVLLVGVLFVPLRNFTLDPDVWWHLKVGSTILATHHWPHTDTYSFTAYGAPWIAYEWLGEILLAAVHHAAGLRGLMALDLVLGGAIVLALYGLATARSGNSKAAFVACALLLPLIYIPCTLRPQMLGYLFLVLTLIILERFRQGHARTLWLLPPIFLAWVNTHGSFVLGLVAVAVYAGSGLVEIRAGGIVSRRWSASERLHLEIAAALILVALILTPYGTEVCLYPFSMAFSQPINVGNIKEWQSMMFGEFFGKLFLVLLLGFILAQLALRLTWRLEEVALFLIGVVAACLHVRFVLLFVPFFAPMLATILARWVPAYDPAQDKYPLNALLMVLVASAAVWFFPTRAKLESVVETDFPVQAVRYLKLHPVSRPMYNTYGYGGYLIEQLDGENQVFVDGRADIYELTGVLADYLLISRLAPATPALLDSYQVQSCLVNREEALATLLTVSPAWRKVYSDKLSALFVRRNDSNQAASPSPK